VDDPQAQLFGAREFSSEKGASRPGGASASARVSGDSKAPRLSGTPHPFARAAEMGASADLASTARIDFRSDQRRVSDNGCTRNGSVGLSRRSTLKADSLLLDRYGRHLRGASRDSSLNQMGFGAVPLTARFDESRGEQRWRAKASSRVRYCRLLVCPSSR
jgi:hypothetical protein